MTSPVYWMARTGLRVVRWDGDTETLVYNPESGDLHLLPEVESGCLTMLGQRKKTVEELRSDLSAQFSESIYPMQDIESCLNRLAVLGLIGRH